MSHHASEELSDDMKQRVFPHAQASLGQFFGATGKFPRGKIDRLDEGEIQFGIAADHKTSTILLNFGKPVVWLGMTADEAIEISNSLRDKALEIKTGSKS